MTLATIDPDGRPAARIVLLKIFDDRGFVFFTNYLSRKGHALAAKPDAALLFFWPDLERQVRIEGADGAARTDGVGCLFLGASSLVAAGSVGVAAKRADRGARGPRSPIRRGGGALCR